MLNMASIKLNTNGKLLIEKGTYSYSCQTETKEIAVVPTVMWKYNNAWNHWKNIPV